MAFEKFFADSTSKYGEGIMLQEYAGNWYLVEGRKPEQGNGTVYKTYGYRTRKKDGKTETVNDNEGNPRSFPWSIKIGSSLAQARKCLQAIAANLPTESAAPEQEEYPF
jgi:hypothetical protein